MKHRMSSDMACASVEEMVGRVVAGRKACTAGSQQPCLVVRGSRRETLLCRLENERKTNDKGQPRCPHITLPAGAVVKSSAYVDLPTTDAHDVPARAVISVDMRASDGASLSDCGGLHGGSGLRHGY
jgi:hypothetical protein